MFQNIETFFENIIKVIENDWFDIDIFHPQNKIELTSLGLKVGMKV